METEQKDCSLKVEKLIEKHAWITSERQLFGKSGTDYDFTSRDPKKANEKLERLQAEQSGCVTMTNKFVILLKSFILSLRSVFHVRMLKKDSTLLFSSLIWK